MIATVSAFFCTSLKSARSVVDWLKDDTDWEDVVLGNFRKENIQSYTFQGSAFFFTYIKFEEGYNNFDEFYSSEISEEFHNPITFYFEEFITSRQTSKNYINFWKRNEDTRWSSKILHV